MTDDALLDAWVAAVCAELGLAADVGELRPVLLDLARDAAHNVMRPAAPMTTFLVGLAAGHACANGTPIAQAVTEAAAKATTLSEQFSQPN
jgi:hypothetical protein